MRLPALCLALVLAPGFSIAQPSAPPAVPAPSAPHEGAHDFDALLGNATFHLRFMLHPLTSNPEWTEMNGTGACYKVWDGRAQMDTVELDSAAGGHNEGITLRLYDPEARQWR